MRCPLSCLFVYAFLSGLFVTVLAKDDPNYNPAENFRPENVTGLNSMYAWVGSYYNATTEMELTPQMGPQFGAPLCPPLHNYTKTMKWNSILAITERGTYDTGPNPVNIWLTLIPPHYNWSTLPSEESILYSDPFWWVLESSTPIWRDQENANVPDNFNITATKLQNSFSLAGTLGYYPIPTYDHIWMPTCNSSFYYGNWSVSLLLIPGNWWWSTKGWKNFTLPKMNGTFDAQTANFTLDGDFQAQPFLRSNDTLYNGGESGEIGEAVQGTIRFTVKGVLDAYHSDVLNMNTSSPTWLRTVGFGNNSHNIGNTSAAARRRPGLGAATIMMALAIFTAFY